MEIILLIVLAIIVGAFFFARAPKGKATGNPTVDQRSPGEN